jgi:hypothetical protein
VLIPSSDLVPDVRRGAVHASAILPIRSAPHRFFRVNGGLILVASCLREMRRAIGSGIVDWEVIAYRRVFHCCYQQRNDGGGFPTRDVKSGEYWLRGAGGRTRRQSPRCGRSALVTIVDCGQMVGRCIAVGPTGPLACSNGTHTGEAGTGDCAHPGRGEVCMASPAVSRTSAQGVVRTAKACSPGWRPTSHVDLVSWAASGLGLGITHGGERAGNPRMGRRLCLMRPERTGCPRGNGHLWATERLVCSRILPLFPPFSEESWGGALCMRRTGDSHKDLECPGLRAGWLRGRTFSKSHPSRSP